MSALPPKADITAGPSESPLCAMSVLMQCSDLVALARKLTRDTLERDVSLLDHGLPFFRLGREQGSQLFRRRADGHHADVIEVCLDGRIAQGGDRINVDLFDDCPRCSRRNEECKPPRYVETAHARLRSARQARRQLAALGGGHRKSANLAAPDLLEHRAAADLQIDPPGDRIRERGSIAPIRYMRHLDARDLLTAVASANAAASGQA